MDFLSSLQAGGKRKRTSSKKKSTATKKKSASRKKSSAPKSVEYAGRKYVVHIGAQGGKYIVRHGDKVYL